MENKTLDIGYISYSW